MMLYFYVSYVFFMMDKSAVDPLEREISRVDEKKKVKMSEFLGVME